MATGSFFKVVDARRVRVTDTSDLGAERNVTVSIGELTVRMSREEAAQLGAELLNAAGAVPVEVAA